MPSRKPHAVVPRLLAGACLLSLATTLAAAELSRYELDPVHTRVVFAIEHAGFSHAIGTVSGTTGTLVFDPDDWSSARLEASVPLTRVDLGDADWNRAALAGNLLDVDDFPVATFVSTRVEPAQASRAVVDANTSADTSVDAGDEEADPATAAEAAAAATSATEAEAAPEAAAAAAVAAAEAASETAPEAAEEVASEAASEAVSEAAAEAASEAAAEVETETAPETADTDTDADADAGADDSNTDAARICGDLTLHGVTREVCLDVTMNALKRHPLPPWRRTAGFSATTQISRKAFGIDAWPSVIGDTVELRIEAEAIHKGRASVEDAQDERAPPPEALPVQPDAPDTEPNPVPQPVPQSDPQPTPEPVETP